MNTQHLETQNEAEAERHRLAPMLASASEEIAASQLPSEAEIRQAYQQMITQRRRGRLRGRVRSLFTCQRNKAQDSDPLLQMEFDGVLTVLRDETQKRAKRQRLFIGIFLSIVLLFVLVSIFTHTTTMLTNLGSYVSFIAMGAAATTQQKTAALAISRFDDVRAVGPLAEALEFKDQQVVPMAEKALISLLPRLKASDAALLSPTQRHCLNRALKGKNTALTLAILKAWEQVGDTGAIAEVEKLAEGRGRAGRLPKVVEAAKECLPFLRQSAERQQVGSQLLRPADGNLTPSDVLLRAAMPHTSTDPADQLLRPTENTL
ncbi:MAG: hypothetical protein JWN14_2517 [Chthonomonadales bacterium]|nr:hypothetical protein [Chthonomonadales bacterium]